MIHIYKDDSPEKGDFGNINIIEILQDLEQILSESAS
jgi:hypothetical protein